jgi:hypothetical protein
MREAPSLRNGARFEAQIAFAKPDCNPSAARVSSMRTSVAERLTIARVYELAAPGQPLRRYGRNALVRCPVRDHPDRHPSCLLDETRNRWKCLGCGGRGGMLDLVVAAGHAPDPASAARWLEERTR